jgi:hypothetical protein
LAGKQAADLEKALAAPWASDKVDDFFARAREKIAATRTDLSKMAAFDAKKFTPKSPLITPKEIHFGKAEAYASKEAANTILRSRYGGGLGSKDAAKTAAATEASRKALEKLVAFAAAGPGIAVMGF